MKKIFLSILFLGFVGSIYSKDEQKDSPKTDTKKTNVTPLIRPLLTNIATLGKHSFKVAAHFKDIKRSAENLKPDFECLIDRKSESCHGISCATLSKCVGTTLSDLLKVVYPFLEAILGSVDSEGTVAPGSLFAIVDTAEKIPAVIPTALYAKLGAESYLPKVEALVGKLKGFRNKLPALTKNFSDAMAMLNGVVATLNPEMLVEAMPIKPLPAVKALENGESLSKELSKDEKLILVLPAIEDSK